MSDVYLWLRASLWVHDHFSLFIATYEISSSHIIPQKKYAGKCLGSPSDATSATPVTPATTKRGSKKVNTGAYISPYIVFWGCSE